MKRDAPSPNVHDLMIHCKDLNFVFCSTSTPHDCFCTETVSIWCNLLLVKCGASRSVFIKWEKGSIGFSLAWDNSELLCPTTWGERVDEKKEGSIKKTSRHTEKERPKEQKRQSGKRYQRCKGYSRQTWEQDSLSRPWGFQRLLPVHLSPALLWLINQILFTLILCSFPEATISNA